EDGGLPRLGMVHERGSGEGIVMKQRARGQIVGIWTTVLVLGALGASILFVGFAGSTPTPTTITYVCANNSTRQLSYVTPACPKSSTSVPVTSTSTQFKACSLASSGVTRKVSNNTPCSDNPRKKENTIPKVPADSTSLYFCVDSSGTMYFTGS